MSRNLVVPPNFVTLRHLKELKEKREEEERLKKEEEERLRKLKEEEEERERLRKLEEEEDRLRKLKEEEESRKNPSAKTLESKGPYRRKWRGWGSRRGVKPDAQLSRGGANVEAQVAANGGSGGRGSISGANLEAELTLGNGRSAVEISTVEKLKKKKKNNNNWERKKEKEAEMPLGLNGSDEGRKGFGAPAEANGFQKEKKSTNVTLKANRSDKKISGGVSHRPVKVIGSESGAMVADIGKRVSDLRMGGRNPNRSWRERSYWAYPSRRGGGGSGSGSGSVMMWVKKTTTDA